MDIVTLNVTNFLNLLLLSLSGFKELLYSLSYLNENNE